VTATTGNFATLNASSTISDAGTFGKLCVGVVCITLDQFMSVFGNQSAAADAPSAGSPQGAPANDPASDEGKNAEPPPITTNSGDAGTLTASAPPANDDPSSAEAPTTTLLVDTPPEPTAPKPAVQSAPANDNSPIVPLSATGTDVTSTAQ
jgi:hypothetical protein